MSAAATDKFKKVGRSTATTLSSPGYTIGDVSITVGSTSNWPTSTGVTFAVDTVDGAGVQIAGTYNIFKGVVTSATQISSLAYVGGDANRDYTAGATTRVYIDIDYSRHNEMIDGIVAEHNQDGTHSDITADSAAITGALSAGATTLSGALVTAVSDTNARLGDIVTFTSDGTWTKDANLKFVIVEVQAGGGGGGGTAAPGASQTCMAGGGGGGGYSRKKIAAASLGATETVTVGAGGTAGSTGNGGTGGTSSFGTHATATGGSGGVGTVTDNTAGRMKNGGVGGIGSSGDLNTAGAAGGNGVVVSNAGNIGYGGAGGNSRLGGGSTSAIANSHGQAGGNYGGGGGGCARADTNAGTGGAGAAGIVIVSEYY